MTPEEEQRRYNLVVNLLSHPENPNNASVAQMVANGPYSMNDRQRGQPQQDPYAPPQAPQQSYPPAPSNAPIMGSIQDWQNQGAPQQRGGSADIMQSAPIQPSLTPGYNQPVINPTNPSFSPSGPIGPSQHLQTPTININIGGGQPASPPDWMSTLSNWLSPPQAQSQPPQYGITPWNAPRQGGPTADVLGNYNAPQRPMVPISPLMGQSTPRYTSPPTYGNLSR